MTYSVQNDSARQELAAFILRVSLGVMFIAHAWLKIAVFTLPGTVQYFGSLGLPPALAYFTVGAELVGGIMLLLGAYSRYVALALVPVLIGATWAHSGNGWSFSVPNGGWEYPAFLAITAVVQFLLGDGAYALRRTAAPARLRAARVAA